MAEKPVLLTRAAIVQIQQVVREYNNRNYKNLNEPLKRGRWQGRYPITSGSQRIWFTIVSVECVSETEVILTVLPTHYTGGCTAAIPGEDSYGYVIVEDVCSILLFYTAAWLVGKTGAATYMYPRSGYCEPLWLVDTICGSPECA
jgi:hypothetical protein